MVKVLLRSSAFSGLASHRRLDVSQGGAYGSELRVNRLNLLLVLVQSILREGIHLRIMGIVTAQGNISSHRLAWLAACSGYERYNIMSVSSAI